MARLTDQPQQTNATDRQFAPGIVLLLIFGLLTARWIWIAGITDYAWIYELGMRIRQGEVPYRDFISTLPQLTSYTLVPFLVLLKGNLWGFALHLYLWWLASLWAGLLVARKLGLSARQQSAAIFLAACISFPPVGLGHPYSYAGTFFSGLVMLCLLRHRALPKALNLLLAGASTGLALLAKQNIGLVALVFGIVTVGQIAGSSEKKRSLVGDVFVFVVGVLIVFLPGFGYFAVQAGADEVWAQMFVDAGAGKGGLDRMLANMLPLIPFTLESSDYQMWTLPISGLISLAFLALFGYLADIGQTRKAAPDGATNLTPVKLLAIQVGAFGIVALVSIVSLLNLPQLRTALDALIPRFVYGYIGPLVSVWYAALNALSVITLVNLWLRKRFDLTLPALALPMVLWGHEISAHGYLVYSAPLAVPLAFHLADKQFVRRPGVQLAYVLGAFCVFIHAFFPHGTYRLSTFEALHRLPDNSRFAHLWAARSYAEGVNEILTNVTPHIQGHPTLWIVIGGPHLAFGGASVRSVATLHFDTYNVRSEPALMEAWHRQPPEFVFVGHYLPCVGSRHFTREALGQWLSQNYQRVWQSPDRPASLWELNPQAKPTTN
jgi:hypothetical protein